MAQEEVATDVARLTKLSKERDALSEDLEKLYELWESLSEEKESQAGE